MRTIRGLNRLPGRAFTLVEMIGVLAILAIVLALVAPSVVRQFQTATAMGEDAKLDDIAQALTNAIRATGFIPNPNQDPATTNATDGYGWAYLASNYTKLAGANLLSVFPGSTTDTRRRVYLSTNLAGAASDGGFANTISNWGPTFFPTNAKMYVVSSSRPDFALALAANGPGAQTNANNYADPVLNSLENWNKQFSNGVCVAPTTLVDSSWTNKGEFLHVRTVDLSPIFNEARAAQQKISDQEDKNLEEIARALVVSIQANGQIPNPNVASTNTSGGWVYLASPFSSLGQDAFQYSFPLISTNERRVYLDTNVASLPLSTPAGGWAAAPVGPASLFIVSSSKQDLDLECLRNGAGANNSITNSLGWLRSWVRTPNTPILSSVAVWTNRGEFLHVRSVDLQSLFCEVQLNDTAAPVTVSLSGSSSYTNIPAPQTYQGTTVTFKTNTSSNLEILSIFPSQNLSGLTNRTTNPTNVTSQSVPGGNDYLTFQAPGAPQFSIKGLAPQVISDQSTNFFVLKGSTLNLINSTATSTNSFIIQRSSQFKFYGGSWQQIY